MNEIIRNWGYLGPKTPNRRYDVTAGQLMNGFSIGIMQPYSHFPFFPGEIANAYSYNFPVRIREIENVHLDSILAGDKSVADAIVDTARKLEIDGCRVICANCGFFGHFQKYVSDRIDSTCYLSSMLQVPWALISMKPSQKLGVITAQSATLDDELLHSCGITDAMKERLVIVDTKQKEEFQHMIAGAGGLDNDKTENELMEVVADMMNEHPDIGAILFECTDMPPYAYRVQAEYHLPVYDAVTLIRYAASTVMHKPYYGFI